MTKINDTIINNTSIENTIYALSSAPGKAGVAIIRVSGDQAWEGLKQLTPQSRRPTPKMAVTRKLYHPVTGNMIDHAMVIGFTAPRSFTGEDCVEYHCHGSPAVIEELQNALQQISGHRQAMHGEFTRRAFENDKMDLTAAEAIADLIHAETAAQKDQALIQMGGALADLYHGWAKDLTKSLAYIEAIIDFPDEDVPDEETAKAKPAIEQLIIDIKNHLDDNRRGERLRDGLSIALIGAPNVGKSSLINLLSQRDVAIVSDIPGTTRDVMQVPLNLGGYPVIISDTAGLRPDQLTDQGQDKIESEGIKRALKCAQEADLKILLFDAGADEMDKDTLALVDDHCIIVFNKSDLNEKNTRSATFINAPHGEPSSPWLSDKNTTTLNISIKEGVNIDSFIEQLTQHVAQEFSKGQGQNTPSLTRQRYRTTLQTALAHMEQSLYHGEPELMAQELRFAINQIGTITGQINADDLLDVIFKDFCIGK